MARILVVDDEAGMRRSVGIMLRRAGHEVEEVGSGAEALARLSTEVFDLVLSDLRMSEISGLDVLTETKRLSPLTEVIMMTAYGTIETAVAAMRGGAFDFVTKPFQVDELLHRVERAVERRRLSTEVQQLRAEAHRAFGIDAIVGASEALRRIVTHLPRIALSDSTVLVTGESGTGKELIARAIHHISRRAAGPFITVSAAAFPEALLESELFGHVKGAFTGAHGVRKGLIEEAHGGTFFLDEIGEAPQAVQTKLLRVLEERTIRRLGDNRAIDVDARIVAATNRDLEQAVRVREFREDLFYRLNVIRIHLPPLRERPDDIPLLARHFVAVHRGRSMGAVEGFTAEAIGCLLQYPFPGNVRELSNIVEQAMALCSERVIDVEDLPERVQEGDPGFDEEATLFRAVGERERDVIVERIVARAGNLRLVAKDLKVSRTTLWRRMKAHHIDVRSTVRPSE
jgi:two-component system, NtrC family, response regulator HydG